MKLNANGNFVLHFLETAFLLYFFSCARTQFKKKKNRKMALNATELENEKSSYGEKKKGEKKF